MNASPFIHAEADLVAALGLARAVVRTVRTERLTRGTHWNQTANEVRYSAEGRTLLFSILKAEPEKNPPGPPGEAEPLPPPARRADLLCAKIPRNRRIVLATLDGEPMRVRVRDSARILPGMTLTCTHVQADLWELSQPLPRSRGRW